MNTSQLAKRLNVSQPNIAQLEQAEVNDTVTLASLRRVAHAMDCELIYAIVPKTSLEEIIEQQAYKIAVDQLKRTSHTMQLEQQGVTKKQQKELLKELVLTLIQGKPKKIWTK
jgi:predicted DNA-binding mobile mystery protein A